MSDPLDIPTLTTARLLLEPLSLAHSGGMFALWSQPEVCRFSGPAFDLNGAPIRLPAETIEDSDKIIVFFLKGAADGLRFRWAVRRCDGGGFVGAVGFNALGPCAEMAWHLAPEAWGQGLMGEAAQAALAWLSARPGAETVDAFVEPDNTASIRLAERLGLCATGEVSGTANRYRRAL